MCGQDVSGKPRSKDAQGRYVCAECMKGKAPAAKAAPKAEKAGASEDNAFLLDLGGPSAAANVELCPGCQRQLKVGAKICTLCGFNVAEGRALKTRISKDKEKKEAGAAKEPMSAGQKLFIVAMLPAVLGAGLQFAAPEIPGVMGAYLIYSILGLVTLVWGIIAGFKENFLHGILMIVTLGLWGLYFIFFKQEDGRLKALYGAGWLGGLIVAIAAQMTGTATP